LANFTATGTPATDGTSGVISGITNSASVSVGMYVMVSAGFATTGPFVVLGAGTTSIVVNANSNSVQSGVTVSQGAPVFPAFSSLPVL
jgi:hypothetical protein